ncbi:S8 family serine peptidase [Metabacillus sp. 113a]|uniref:S8 family serine peptidase n=1 Tax=Metabacillus sp. 113a TaxID=3404706 RepID=UPI003CEBD24E
MKKRMMSFFILFSLLLPHASSATYTFPEKPPLPDRNRPDKAARRIFAVAPERWEAFKSELKTDFRNVEIRREYSEVFKGASIEGSSEDLALLSSRPYVEDLGPVAAYKAEAADYVAFVGGDRVRGLFDGENQRLTGKGIKVGVIDTGMDYRHPDLRKNYAGGYDLVDDDRDPMETMGDEDVATLHGTHVAGIIAANGKIRGIAPDASLYIYRALGPGGTGTSEQIIAAIDRAVKDKVDILNLSLGNDVNGPDWPTSLALNKAVEKGIVAVAAGGNSGPGKWTLGSPGTAEKAISVGASTPPIKAFTLRTSGMPEPVRLIPFQGAAQWKTIRSAGMVYAGFGREKEFPADSKGKLVIAQRGKIPFTEMALAAQKKGAAGILVHNNQKGSFSGNMKNITIPAASISKEDGLRLRKLLHERADISQTNEQDTLASFSSRGPVTGNWGIKPDVVAPGVEILSTIPGNQYKKLQGTSMASPLVAGAAALVKQAHPDWSPGEIKAALMNTAKPLMDRHAALYEPIGQGAGRIDVWKAVNTEVLAVPGSLVFSQFSSGQRRSVHKARLNLINHSGKVQRFSFIYPGRADGLTWRFPKTQYVQPRSSREVEIVLEGTPIHLADGTHQGWLKMNAGREEIDIPYLFMMNEPDYPRLMGFDLQPGDEPETLQYELYLPGGADEIGIALYDPASYHFIGYLDWVKNAGKGRLKKVLSRKEINVPDGPYKALIFAEKGNSEDIIEAVITIDFHSQH